MGIIGGVVFYMANARGALPPTVAPLADYDKRSEASSQAEITRALAARSSQWDEAVNSLRSILPDVQISRDNILGTPRLIKSARGLLTGPAGQGRAVGATFLSAIPADDPHRVVRAFLNEHAALFGHNADALSSSRITRDYTTDHNGLRTTVWEQTLEGIPVFEGLLTSHVTRHGELISISSQFIPNPAAAGDSGTPDWRAMLVAGPATTPARALVLASANVGVEIQENTISISVAPEGPERKQTVAGAGLFGPASLQLIWLPMNGDSMRLCWEVLFTVPRSQAERYLTLVDSETGEVLLRRSMTLNISPATYNVFTNDSPSPMSPGLSAPGSTQPTNVNRVSVTLGALDTTASPNGWINDGDRQTSGNNASAFLDRNLDGLPDVPLPSATGTNRVFDFPLNLTNQPTTYQSASTVQLFYRANWYHDKLYQLGFTEAAGNYQITNFNKGGLGGDPVLCLVQAGADIGEADNSAFLSAPDGQSGYCLMFVFTGPNPDRDGSLDSEVVLHELTHGLTTRLVGNGSGISALQTEGMGEGWSDFYSLVLLSEPSDDVNAVYAEGGYVTFDLAGTGFNQNYYYGVRRYPYTTDMSKNPLTFRDIDPAQASPHFGIPVNPLFGGSNPSEVHNQGEVWCVTLREMWANLVTTHGWNVGNQLALQLVTDGLKLAPANPNFLEARDAIIEADLVDTGGENYVDIWNAFAKRGMGKSASSPNSDTTFGVVEAFDLPPDAIPDGILEINVNPPDSTVLFFGETVPITIRVSDALPVTNATISVVLNTGTNLIFRNNGVAPDTKANDGIYTANFTAPSNQSFITFTAIISATNKQTATNVFTYAIFPPPPNDFFTTAIKVPAGGTNYITSNKRATIESNEPKHGGDAAVAGSLWWNYTATFNTNILVDTVGSDFRSVVAVYTNSTLSTNMPSVAADVGSPTHRNAAVVFSVQSGVTYHIAAAGFNASNLGTLRLNIVPGLQPDTNAPSLVINAPTNGLIVTTNRIPVFGSAVDGGSNPSGIHDITINVSPSLGGEGTVTTVTPSSLIGPLSTNWASVVGLFPGVNTISVSVVDYAGNRSDTASLQVTYRPQDPVNDYFANALSLTAVPDVSTVNSINATKETGEPNHAGNQGGKSVWWTYQAPGDGVLSLSTTNSSFDTLLAIYTGATVNALTLVSSNDDAYIGAPHGFSQLVQAVRTNQTYRIAVDGYDGSGGVVFLSYSFVPATIFNLVATNTPGGTVSPVSVDVQSNGIVTVTATPNPNYTFDLWDGDVLALGSSVNVTVRSNMTITAHFRPVAYSDGFESGDLRHLTWTTNLNTPWIIQTNAAAGSFATRSGAITNNQNSSLVLTTNFHAGTGSFDYKVSSDPNSDFLKFYVDGVLLQQWSGEIAWSSYAFPLTSGTHTLEWRYSKDPAFTAGLDAAFIDDVILPIVVPPDSSAPAHLELKRQTDGSPFIELQGQTNQTYVLQGSIDLIHWQDLSTQTAVNGILRIPITTTDVVQFYRAIVAP